MSFKGTTFGFVVAISALLAFAKAYAEEPSLPAPPDIEDLGLMPDTGLKSKQETAKEESDALNSLDSEKNAADSLGDPNEVSSSKKTVEVEEGEVAPPPPAPKAKKSEKKQEPVQKEEEMAPPPDVPEAPAASSAEQIPEPSVEKASAPSSETENAEGKIDKYMVVKGDNLWNISGMGAIYGNSFQWPLIFRANRDHITDPDLIYPEQNFSIRHDYSEEEVKKAIEDASKTPAYLPHTKPRETLPVDYF